MELENTYSVVLSPNKYTSVSVYFKDYYQLRKQEDPTFSFEKWSDELGFKSRSYLRMVCSGNREVTQKLVHTFSESNGLKEEQTEHLTLIALYQKAETPQEKKIYLDKIFESLETTTETAEVKDYARFLSNIQLPVIQLIASFKIQPQTLENLGRILNTETQIISKNLNQLKQMGLVREIMENNQSYWTATNKSFNVPDQQFNQALEIYYKQTLIEAESYLTSNEIQKRFRSIFFTLSDDNYTHFVKDAEAFLLKMRHKYSSEQINDKRVFKVNLFAYPVTKKSHKTSS